jgi:hypothetical protein
MSAWLLLGVVLTVIVAWVCTYALIRIQPKSRVYTAVAIPSRWEPHINGEHRASVFGARHRIWKGSSMQTIGLDDRPLKTERISTSHRLMFVKITEAGWPFPALRYEDWLERKSTHPPGTAQAITEDHPSSVWRRGLKIGRYTLGIRPLWPGFALNSVLYATSIVGLWGAATRILRHVRRRGARCVKCGYDLQGSPGVCPECGS